MIDRSTNPVLLLRRARKSNILQAKETRLQSVNLPRPRGATTDLMVLFFAEKTSALKKSTENMAPNEGKDRYPHKVEMASFGW